MKKRNMSLILVLALILCLIPATAFADTTWSGNIGAQEVKDTVTVSDTATITGAVTVTSGKITIPDGATLKIDSGYLYLNSDAVNLEIQDGGKLVVNGILYTKKDLGDNIKLLGSMEVSGSASGVEINRIGKTSTGKIGGGTSEYQLKLDSTAKATITSLEDGGYNYEITSGTATTKKFTNSGKDELVVANGAVLDASAGMTLNGISYAQLTVENGGKLILPNNEETAAKIMSDAYSGTKQLITSGTYSINPREVGSGKTDYVEPGYLVDENAMKGEWTVKPAGNLSKIAITLKEPVVGETPATSYKWTVNPAKSAKPTMKSETDSSEFVKWYKMSKADYDKMSKSEYEDSDEYPVWEAVGKNEKFQKDYYYAFATAFYTINGYEVNDDITVTINGKELSDEDYVEAFDKSHVYIEKVFGPLAEKSPATGDNNELGLFTVAGLISALGVALMLRRKHSM